MPIPTPETAPFWEGAAKGVLRLPVCEACGAMFFPPAGRCPHCLSEAVGWKDLSGRGHVRSWCALFIPAYPGSSKPTLVAEVEPDESRAIALPMLVLKDDEARLSIGGPVTIRFLKDENGWTFPVADPGAATDAGGDGDVR